MAENPLLVGGSGVDGRLEVRGRGDEPGFTVRNVTKAPGPALKRGGAAGRVVSADLGSARVSGGGGGATLTEIASVSATIGTATMPGGLQVLGAGEQRLVVSFNGMRLEPGRGAPVFAVSRTDTRTDMTVGRDETAGRIVVGGPVPVTIDGQRGDVILGNADVAEDFDVVAGTVPGHVVVIGDGGRLEPSRDPYDPRVIGVVSGAGRYAPGIVLDRRDARDGRAPIAMLGKVMCLVDADAAPISAGDLLTTSERPGHAMRVRDRASAVGATIGKALEPLANGQGLLPVLVMAR